MYGILQKLNIEISEFLYQLQYGSNMVLLVGRLHVYYSDDILMIDIQTDPIWHLPIEQTPRNKYILYIGGRFKVLYRL